MKPSAHIVFGIVLALAGLVPSGAADKGKISTPSGPVANPDMGPGGVPVLIRPGTKAEALLDFTGPADLAAWLADHTG